MRIRERLDRLEAKHQQDRFLVVWPETLTQAEIDAWQRQHPRGTVIKVEYDEAEPPEYVIDDVAA